jgi:hypothetical protein
MAVKENPPSISETAFDCPHCGAFTTQQWFRLYMKSFGETNRNPTIPDAELRERINRESEMPVADKKRLLSWLDKIESQLIEGEALKESVYIATEVINLHLSKCYNCKKIAAWVYDGMVFPPHREGISPNLDIPQEIADDFNEARSILALSPRGAAALLRLAVQKLCAFLGEKGKNIDEDIGNLVAKGLSPLVQKALDVVRVVGNEAVHPGVIDLKDDRNTALQLFTLVNLIADQMISVPKAVQHMYGQLPQAKLQAIEERNQRAIGPK